MRNYVAVEAQTGAISIAALERHIAFNLFSTADWLSVQTCDDRSQVDSTHTLTLFLASLKPKVILSLGSLGGALNWLSRYMVNSESDSPCAIVVACDPTSFGSEQIRGLEMPRDVYTKPLNVDTNGLSIFVNVTSFSPRAALEFLASIGVPVEIILVFGHPLTGNVDFFDMAFDHIAEGGAIMVVSQGEEDSAFRSLEKFSADARRDTAQVENVLVLQRHAWHFPTKIKPRLLDERPLEINHYLKKRLALAFIVKNEMDVVVNMLESISPIVGFVACLDTGSSDDTPQVVRNFLECSQIPYVVDTCKFTRFDEVRNCALHMVPYVFDWTLMLDADEILCGQDFGRVVQLVQSEDHDAWSIPRYNWLNSSFDSHTKVYPDRQQRLIRNSPDRRIKYVGAVHESLTGVKNLGLSPLGSLEGGVADRGLHIHHLSLIYKRDNQKKYELYRSLGA